MLTCTHHTSRPWMGSLAANCSHCTRSRSICCKTPNEIAFTFSSWIMFISDLFNIEKLVLLRERFNLKINYLQRE